MGHPVLVPVLRGYKLDKALVTHPGAAECVEVAWVAGFPQMHCRNRPNSRPEGMSGHDQGVVGIGLERGPDRLVNIFRDILPCVVEAAVHFAIGYG